MTWNEYMVIGNRFREQVGNDVLRFEPNLCATEIRLVLIANQLHVLCKDALEVSTNFYQCIIAKRQIGMNGNTDAGLEMAVVFVFFNHVQWNSTMCPKHFAVLGIDASGIALEA